MIKEALAAPGQVDLGENYAFGGIKSLGEGLSYLVTPAFSIATAALLIYLIMGAFKYLKSGGDKEELAKARAMITHAFIGFVLLMFMFLFLQILPRWLGLGPGFRII